MELARAPDRFLRVKGLFCLPPPLRAMPIGGCYIWMRGSRRGERGDAIFYRRPLERWREAHSAEMEGESMEFCLSFLFFFFFSGPQSELNRARGGGGERRRNWPVALLFLLFSSLLLLRAGNIDGDGFDVASEVGRAT